MSVGDLFICVCSRFPSGPPSGRVLSNGCGSFCAASLWRAQGSAGRGTAPREDVKRAGLMLIEHATCLPHRMRGWCRGRGRVGAEHYKGTSKWKPSAFIPPFYFISFRSWRRSFRISEHLWWRGSWDAGRPPRLHPVPLQSDSQSAASAGVITRRSDLCRCFQATWSRLSLRSNSNFSAQVSSCAADSFTR